jgi:hypothetical protein
VKKQISCHAEEALGNAKDSLKDACDSVKDGQRFILDSGPTKEELGAVIAPSSSFG